VRGPGGGLGCLVITVTENGTKLWSITLTGGEVLDRDGKEAVFYQLAHKYHWLETKKEKMDMLFEIEHVLFPRLSIQPIHRKSLIRKLRRTLVSEVRPDIRPGRRPKYNDLDRHHLVQIWRLSGFPCSKRLKSILEEWLLNYDYADSIKGRLKSMSPSQMDEFLRSAKN
jgi:hypothetical protein